MTDRAPFPVLQPVRPSEHRARIKESIAERSPLAGALGMGALTAFASTYHSLGVASYTTVNERIASVGALGMVFVPAAVAGQVTI